MFGRPDANDIGAAVELRAIGIKLIRSTNHPLFQIALDEQCTIGEWHVARAEVVVVLKFMAAVSAWRPRWKRMQDIVDISLVCEAASATLDRARMVELSRLVYPGAEREFSELLDKIDRGETLAI